jgi:hypothetical protein
MAKKRTRTTEEAQRQSRKEVLLARRQAQQTRQLRLAIAGVLGLLLLVLVAALINEFLIVPNRPVAIVNGEEISLRQWQERVRFERAQRIVLLENQLEAFGGDVGIIQQFAGQAIVELQDAEAMGQTVLDQMVDDAIIRQAAEARGITVSDEDVGKAVEESLNYFGGESPTPLPTPTETIVPTPSLTPIPTAVITEEVATATALPTPTLGPTATPRPTATPVSLESFQQEYNDFIGQFRALGVSEEAFRESVRGSLYQERLMEALVEERGVPTEAEQASIFLLSFDNEEEASETKALIEEGDFLTIWNSIRSASPETDEGSTAVASEVVWRTRDDLITSFGEDAAEAAFSLPLNTSSDVLSQEVSEEETRYYILQASGREVRPLAESAVESEKQLLLANFIDQQLTGNLELTEFWRGRTPTQPVLDPKFLAQPTAAPVQPTLPPVQLTPATDEGEAPAEPTAEAPAELTAEPTDDGT